MTDCGEIELINLFSGSKGNCTFIRAGKNKILIDAGGTAKAIEGALHNLGVGMEDISAVFVTHEHSDHTHALPVLAKKYRMPVHMIKQSAAMLGICRNTPLFECLIMHEDEFRLELDGGARDRSVLYASRQRPVRRIPCESGGTFWSVLPPISVMLRRECTNMLYGCSGGVHLTQS